MKGQGGKFLVLFGSGGHMMSPRFHFFFLILISKRTKEQDRFKINWCDKWIKLLKIVRLGSICNL